MMTYVKNIYGRLLYLLIATRTSAIIPLVCLHQQNQSLLPGSQGFACKQPSAYSHKTIREYYCTNSIGENMFDLLSAILLCSYACSYAIWHFQYISHPGFWLRQGSREKIGRTLSQTITSGHVYSCCKPRSAGACTANNLPVVVLVVLQLVPP